MTIYVLRSNNLLKIGFSDDVRKRVQSIASQSPEAIEVVGHMPGCRDVERHLHNVFASSRFAGEWFVETPIMTDVFHALLTPGMPKATKAPKAVQRREPKANIKLLSTRLRDHSALLWPTEAHGQRIVLAAEKLGWTYSRCRDLYYADRRLALRAFEIEEFEKWIARRLALAIAPELRE